MRDIDSSYQTLFPFFFWKPEKKIIQYSTSGVSVLIHNQNFQKKYKTKTKTKEVYQFLRVSFLPLFPLFFDKVCCLSKFVYPSTIFLSLLSPLHHDPLLLRRCDAPLRRCSSFNFSFFFFLLFSVRVRRCLVRRLRPLNSFISDVYVRGGGCSSFNTRR